MKGAHRRRTALFAVSSAVLFVLYAWGAFGLPDFGAYAGPYGDVVDALTESATHTTEAVGAVNFDLRAFDTLIEEFILFASVAGVLLLLRKTKEQVELAHAVDHARGRRPPRASDAVRAIVRVAVGPLVGFGVYVVAHGHLTPGGGFQGGVVLATVPLLVYLAGGYGSFAGVTSHAATEAVEALGAAAFLVVGWISILAGLPFLESWLGRGETGRLFSGGVIPIVSSATGVEVTAGFLLLMMTFIPVLALVERRRRS